MATLSPPIPATAATIAMRPGVQRVPSRQLDLFIHRNFLDPDLCAATIDRIGAHRRPSTIADPNGDTSYRTSETCDLDPSNPVTVAIDAHIAAFTGLDPANGEPLQGQRYGPGQEFKPHTDYFEPNGDDYFRFCAERGQRTWTVMIYLNVPEAGGATRFRRIDKTIQPARGKLLAWNNLDSGGRPNGWTLHQGMKVRAGAKYIVTKWYRENPW